MLVRARKFGLPVRRYYFECQRRAGLLETLTPTAFFDCFQADKPNRFFFTSGGHTLLTDLHQPEDELFAGLSKKTRNEIRRFERGSPFVLNKQGSMDDFLPAYNRFAVLRGLSGFTEQDVLAYGAENLCLFSMDKEGRGEIFDLYLLDTSKCYVTGFLSCSPVDQIQNNQQRRQLSIARRYLLWFSYQYFKQAGFKWYDWGGYAPDDPNPVIRQISEFKRSFKGEVTPVYQYYSPTFQAMEAVRSVVNKLRYKIVDK